MKTSVDAAFYRPLLLSGLVTEKSIESIRGIPGIRSIPVFGALFDSVDNNTERFELIAILIPRLSPPNLSRKTEIDLPKGPLPELQSAPDTLNESIWRDIDD
jgi:Flp pilus assembly secretin CpaC